MHVSVDVDGNVPDCATNMFLFIRSGSGGGIKKALSVYKKIFGGFWWLDVHLASCRATSPRPHLLEDLWASPPPPPPEVQ